VSCCCEQLVAEVTGTIREPRGRGTSAVGSRYQTTASGDSNRLENTSLCVTVIFKVLLRVVRVQ
jgi:hypothetical protein